MNSIHPALVWTPTPCYEGPYTPWIKDTQLVYVFWHYVMKGIVHPESNTLLMYVLWHHVMNGLVHHESKTPCFCMCSNRHHLGEGLVHHESKKPSFCMYSGTMLWRKVKQTITYVETDFPSRSCKLILQVLCCSVVKDLVDKNKHHMAMIRSTAADQKAAFFNVFKMWIDVINLAGSF